MIQPKEIKSGIEVKKLIAEGVNSLANAVKVTYGPKGNNVIIDFGINSLPHVTKDGVTVANNINLLNPFENLGCLFVKDAANKVAGEGGDGTTTVTILIQGIINRGIIALSQIDADGNQKVNQVNLKRGMEIAKDFIISEIKKASKKVNNNKQIYDVATISSNNDKKLGKIISEIYKKISHRGVINLADSVTNETTYEVIKGLKFENGYMSSQFVNNKGKGTIIYENCYILLTNRVIKNVREIQKIVENVVINKNAPIIIICEDMEQPVLSSLVLSNNSGSANLCAIKTPKFGSDRKKSIEDLSIYTGAKIIDFNQDMELSNVKIEDLGYVSQITIKRNSTTIVNNGSQKEIIEERISEIEKEIKETKSNYVKKSLKERLAKLSGGIGIIYVGGDTDIEILQKKDRLEDAIEATKSSIEEGVIPGGGSFFYRLASIMPNNPNKEIQEGIDIVGESLKDCMNLLFKYSPIESDEIIKFQHSEDYNFGINFDTGLYCDLIKEGIIDPAKVARLTIENSTSVAIMLLTTDCAISPIPDYAI